MVDREAEDVAAANLHTSDVSQNTPPDLAAENSMLIAEDDCLLCQRLADAMTERGFDVTAVTSVAEGLKAIGGTPPTYAIFDMKLGDGSGLELMAKLHEHRPDARAIMLTGYGNLKTVVAAVTFGAFDYLAKPADADEIYNVLVAKRHDQAELPAHPMSADEVRIGHIKATFDEVGGNVSETARRLGMHRRTLQRIIARANIAVIE